MGTNDTSSPLGRADSGRARTGGRTDGGGGASTRDGQTSGAVGWCVNPRCARKGQSQTVGRGWCECGSQLAQPVPSFLLSLEAKRRARGHGND